MRPEEEPRTPAGQGPGEQPHPGGARPGEQPKSKIPVLCGTVLISEVFVIYFAALTGYGLRPVALEWVLIGATVLALVCLLAVVLLPRRRGQRRPGIALGWAAQVMILAGGFVMPAMFFVGAVFAVMWAVGVYWGRRIDRELTAWGR